MIVASLKGIDYLMNLPKFIAQQVGTENALL